MNSEMRGQLLFFVVVIAGAALGVCDGQRVVFCYVPNWGQYRAGAAFLPKDVEPSLCTHLLYAFHQINVTDNTLQPIEWNYRTVLHPQLQNLTQASPDLKLILAVGGATAPPFSWRSVSSRSKVNAFASNVVSYLRQEQFHGLSVDWEWPQENTQQDYLRLVQALRNAFDSEVLQGREKLLLMTDVRANQDNVKYYSPANLTRAMDFINVMAYDFYGTWSPTIGHHSPLYLSKADEGVNSFNSQDKGIEMWHKAGVPLNKLVLGLAAYGRSMILSSVSQHQPGQPWTRQLPPVGDVVEQNGVVPYYKACSLKTQSQMTEVFMDESRVPYVYGQLGANPVWIGYDNTQSFKEKAAYVKSEGLAGVMIWSINFDDFTGKWCNQEQNYPLLRTINTVFSSSDITTPIATQTTTTTMSTNLPNTSAKSSTSSEKTQTTVEKITLSTIITTSRPETTSTTSTTQTTATQTKLKCGQFECPVVSPYAFYMLQIFPDPTNCEYFYLCAKGHTPFRLQCPGNMHYNPKLKACDYPSQANCKPCIE